MTDFKKNPAKALQGARPQPLAVLNRKRVEFFVLSAALYKALVERVDSGELEELTRRLAGGVETLG